MATLAIFATFIVLLISGSIVILWALARLFKAPNNKLRYASLAFVATTVISVPATLFEKWVGSSDSAAHLPATLYWLVLLGALALHVVIYKFSFNLSWPKAIGLFLANVVCAGLFAIGGGAVLRSTLVHPYECNSVACAPTLVGRHRVDKCPNCGGILMVRELRSPVNSWGDDESDNDGICIDCNKFSVAKNPSTNYQRADLIMSAVYLRPKRWDLVVYAPPTRRPGDDVVWVSRVVGLPGERILIKDGAVYINGEKVNPPQEIAGLEYVSDIVPGHGTTNFVDADNPQQLGDDEYCLLGDFSKNSLDSRYFGPVKRDAIQSVVTVCYWPPSRWRIWR